MKFLTTFAVMALASAGAFAQTSFTYSVKGDLKDNSFDGKMVYITEYNSGAKIDSALVKGASFDIKGKSSESSFCRVFLSRSLFANIILEPGVITVDMGRKESAKGGKLNEAMAEVDNSIRSLNNELMNKQKELNAKYTDKAQVRKAFMEYYDTEMVKAESQGKNFFAKNNNNAVGEYLVNTLFFPQDIEKQEKLIASFGPWLKSRKVVVRNLETLASLKNTAEGKQFLDVKGKDINGKPVSLSDFVGKGDYVLVDMWASWCGPCKGEIPNIAKLYNQYKGKGFNVVGIFVWDKEPNLKKAVEAEKAIWPQIFDSNEMATKLYGVNGIPSIMLIGPDGKIVKRGLRGEQMIKFVDDIMSKK